MLEVLFYPEILKNIFSGNQQQGSLLTTGSHKEPLSALSLSQMNNVISKGYFTAIVDQIQEMLIMGSK